MAQTNKIEQCKQKEVAAKEKLKQARKQTRIAMSAEKRRQRTAKDRAITRAQIVVAATMSNYLRDDKKYTPKEFFSLAICDANQHEKNTGVFGNSDVVEYFKGNGLDLIQTHSQSEFVKLEEPDDPQPTEPTD
jgi:hypothetical protein